MDDSKEAKENLVGKGNGISTIVINQDSLLPRDNNDDVEKRIQDNDTEEKSRSPTWSDVRPQVVACCIALSIAIQSGIGLSFSSVLIPQLAEEIEGFTKVEASWTASLTTITIPLGALFVGPIMDLIGRKATCSAACFPIMASWIITYFAGSASLWPIYLARALIGFGSGLTTAAVVYTAEVTCVQFRPALLCLNSVSVALGILIATTVGVTLDWRTTSICFGILSLGNLLLTLTIPESPYWLVHFRKSEERIQRAKAALRSLNKPQWLFQAEWKHLQDSISQRPETPGDESRLSRLKEFFGLFGNRSCYLPLLLLMGLFLLQQLSGVYVIIFYAVNIFESVGGHFGAGVDGYTATAIVGIVRFVMSVVTIALARRFGRRSLLMTSSLGMALSGIAVWVVQFSAGARAEQFITSTNSSSTSAQGESFVMSELLTLVFLLVFVCFAAFGHMALPWVMISELLPIKVRGMGNGLMVSYAYILMFGVIKSTPFLLDSLGLASVFLGFGSVAASCIAFVYFYLPETFGKSFAEIEKHFEKKS